MLATLAPRAQRGGEDPVKRGLAGSVRAWRTTPGGEQLELTLGPLYVVMVDDRVSGPLTNRPARHYRSPPQALEEARCLALLLLDRGEELDGDGPWRRPLPGGQRQSPSSARPRGSIG